MGSSTNIPILFISLIMAALPHLIHSQNSPEDFLAAHNGPRAEVGVPPLVWDEKVAEYAQQYANERSIDCSMQHSNGPYGENLAWGSWDMSAKEAVLDIWVSEKKVYDAVSNTCVGGAECRHYTQVVWRDTARVGCARSKCANGYTFVTCNYDPRGNYIGERPY